MLKTFAIFKPQLGTVRSLHLRRANCRPILAKSIMASAAANAKDDVQGEMLQPSVFNNPILRFASLAAVTAGAAKATAFLPTVAIGFVHMLAFCTWFGTLAWTSFVFGIVAFSTLPRQMFGRLQSKLFPKYFTLSSISPALLLATLHYIAGGTPPTKEVTLLAVALASSLLNLFWVEPSATKIMFERYELENAQGARDENAVKSLKSKFGKWHGISSLLNLVVLVCAVGHAYYLGGHLVF